MRSDNERERTIWQFVTVKNKLTAVFIRLSCYWQWISSYHCKSSLRIHQAISYFDNVMTKFMINNRTDAWKTDVNMLIWPYFQRPRSSSKYSASRCLESWSNTVFRVWYITYRTVTGRAPCNNCTSNGLVTIHYKDRSNAMASFKRCSGELVLNYFHFICIWQILSTTTLKSAWARRIQWPKQVKSYRFQYLQLDDLQPHRTYFLQNKDHNKKWSYLFLNMLQLNAVFLHRIHSPNRTQYQRQYQAKLYPHLAKANGIPQNVLSVWKTKRLLWKSLQSFLAQQGPLPSVKVRWFISINTKFIG